MYRITDLHCDTLTAGSVEDIISGNRTAVTLTSLVKGGVFLQCFAVCTPANVSNSAHASLYESCVSSFRRIISAFGMTFF